MSGGGLEAAKLLVRIQADVADLKKITEAGEETDKAGKKMKGAFATATRSANELVDGFLGIDIASLGTVAGLVGLAKGTLDFAKAAGESQQSAARLDAVFRATGGTVGMTRASLDDLANSMMYATGADDEMLAGAEAVLLTFDKIQGDIFPRTMRAAEDLSAVMGGEVTGAVEMLGKALSVPETGFTLLKRAGVIYTEQQQAMIKAMAEAGNMAGAQAALLDVLEKKVGGVAAEMGNTYPGQVKKLETALENLKETIGMGLVPGLTSAATALDFLLNWQGKVANATSDHSKALVKTTSAYDEYIQRVWEDLKASGAVEESDKYYERRYGEIDKLAQKYGAWTRERFAEERAVVEAAQEKERWLKREGDAAAYAKKYMEDYAAYMGKVPQKTAATTDAVAKQADEWLRLAEGIGQVTRAQVGRAAIDFLEGKKEGKNPADQAKIQEMINKTALDFGLITKNQAEFATAQQQINEAVDKGVVRLEEYPAALDLAKTQLDKFGKIDMGAIFGGLIENASDGSRQLSNVELAAQRLDKLNGMEFDFYVNIHQTGSFPSNNPGVNPTTIGISGKDERQGSSSSSGSSSSTTTGSNKGPGFAGATGGDVKVYGPIHVHAAEGDDLGGILRRLR
jgi:hypothetical protein